MGQDRAAAQGRPYQTATAHEDRVDQRQGSGEAPVGVVRFNQDQDKREIHDVSGNSIQIRARSSMRSNLPSLQIGQRCGSWRSSALPVSA